MMPERPKSNVHSQVYRNMAIGALVRLTGIYVPPELGR